MANSHKASFTVKPRTPRADLDYRTILDRMSELYRTFAEKQGYSIVALDEALSRFALLSVRVVFEGVDFDPVARTDDPKAIFAKFETYLDTACGDLVASAYDALSAYDAPVNEVTAPTPPDDAVGE